MSLKSQTCISLLGQDFGDTIPGHGGIMDRFDCQFLMATFVHVYHSSFIRFESKSILSHVQLLEYFRSLAENRSSEKHKFNDNILIIFLHLLKANQNRTET